MIVFLGLAVYELILLFLYNAVKTQKQKNWLYIIGCIGILLVVGLRSNYTGNDTSNYVQMFFDAHNISWDNIIYSYENDYGYYYFAKLIRSFTDSSVVFLSITAFASLIGVFDFIWNNSKSPILSLYLYVTIGNLAFVMTGIRQAIAMSICMIAVRFIQERKLVWFVLLVWAAAQFHHSAYIFLVTYFLGTRKVNIVSMLTNIIVTVVAYFSYENLLNIANDVLNYDYEVEKTNNGFVFFAILLIIIAFALVTKQYWVKEKKSLVVLNSGIICGIVWVFRLIGRTAERPAMYWLNTIPVMLSESIESLDDKRTRMYTRLIVIGFIFLFFAYRSMGVYYAFGV